MNDKCVLKINILIKVVFLEFSFLNFLYTRIRQALAAVDLTLVKLILTSASTIRAIFFQDHSAEPNCIVKIDHSAMVNSSHD